MQQKQAIARALDSVKWPAWVDTVVSDLMLDAEGETAVAVRVVVRRDEEAIFRDGARLGKVVDAIHAALRRAEIGLWPYVRFVSARDSQAA